MYKIGQQVLVIKASRDDVREGLKSDLICEVTQISNRSDFMTISPIGRTSQHVVHTDQVRKF